ncbi:DMT family transporter [Amnibacterium sp. CER49]|uniref:DMT family transporter n=1 Tax=Amnibacterium sp. CER49 TaxID=3039161 RepID=UPI00244AAFF8|nr:DMT family transporter [Amnibacterium sp. CER49]MDH2444560.1 DMT family transporter [Amnibacterium sp. CER49]
MVVGGVVAALIGAVVLALGAQFQNRGVRSVDERSPEGVHSGFSLRQLLTLVRTGGWLLGTSFLVVAIVLQLVALLLAPLPVVQPLGVLSLVATALLSRPLDHSRLHRRNVVGIVLCVIGITAFVLTAAASTRSSPAGIPAVVPVLALLAAVLVVVGVGWLVGRKRMPPLAFALGGGVCFGFVATLMKIVLDRAGASLHHGSLVDPTTPFTLLVVAAAAVAGLAGISLVQIAYGSGSPDIVVAALTVIDPLVAVSVGIGLLDEARGAPPWSFVVFAVAEAVAIGGVLLMARNPPTPIDEPQPDQARDAAGSPDAAEAAPPAPEAASSST